jgi:hypothetical protein
MTCPQFNASTRNMSKAFGPSSTGWQAQVTVCASPEALTTGQIAALQATKILLTNTVFYILHAPVIIK